MEEDRPWHNRTRYTLTSREEAHTLLRGINEQRPHAELLPLAVRNFDRWVVVDDTAAGIMTDLATGVRRDEAERRSRARKTAQKRRERAMATAAD